MVNRYITENGHLCTAEENTKGVWISVVAPTDAEITALSQEFSLEEDVLRSALDMEERSRLDVDEAYTLIVVNIPYVSKQADRELYDTLPLSIILTQGCSITVCSQDCPILRQFADGKVRDFNTNMKSRFVLQLLYRIASHYLAYLRSIDRRSGEIEKTLHKSTKNEELLELLKLEKSLLYFSTSLRANEAVLEKLVRVEAIKKYPEDEELLEDVIVENKQAIEMAAIYSGVLNELMNAFSSIISNNLNVVMKVLAIITIVMSVPTMIFSAYGMNVSSAGMPFAQHPHGFAIIAGISAFSLIVAGFILAKLRIFK